MTKISDRVLEEAKKYVFDLLEDKIPDELLYHSIYHTIDVMKNAEIIAENMELRIDDLNILRISTLFHDIGFIDIYDGHEEKGVMYAEKFLHDRDIEKAVINQVTLAIRSTKVPQSPKNLISRILCDADLMNMSFENVYLKDVESLRKEWIYCGKGHYTEKEFFQVSLDFFETHEFHTEYGRKILKPRKEKTEEILKKKMQNT